MPPLLHELRERLFNNESRISVHDQIPQRRHRSVCRGEHTIAIERRQRVDAPRGGVAQD